MTVFVIILHLTVFQTIIDQKNGNINQCKKCTKIGITDAPMKQIQVNTTGNVMLQL